MVAGNTRRITVVCWGPDPRLSPNARGHWAALRKAKAEARKEAAGECYEQCYRTWWAFTLPITAVTIKRTFYRPTKRQADIDNLEASTKAHIDGIADALGVNDRIFRYLPSEVIVERGRREVAFDIELEVG